MARSWLGEGMPQLFADGDFRGPMARALRELGEQVSNLGAGGARVPDLDVRDFGAIGDGQADDTAALQAAIDAARPMASVLVAGSWNRYNCGRVRFPRGVFKVSSPLLLHSRVLLVGTGPGTKLKATSDFPAGGALLFASAAPGPAGYFDGGFSDLWLEADAGTGIWAFSHAAMTGGAGCLEAHDLVISTPKGFNLTPYSQNTSVHDVLFIGAVDQMLRVQGNFNRFARLDKEGNTGSTTDPYILVEGHTAGASTANTFQGILIEQASSANKALLQFTKCTDVRIEDLWMEPTQTNGYGLVFDSCLNVQMSGALTHLVPAYTTLKLTATQLLLRQLNTDGTDVPWHACFELDATSQLRIDEVYSRRNTNMLPLALAGRVEVGRFTSRMLITAPELGVAPWFRRARGREVTLANASFESGTTSWTVTGSVVTAAVPSSLAPGQALALGTFGGTVARVTQNVVVPAEWVGRPLVFSGRASHSGAGFVAPYLSGCGIAPSAGSGRAQGTDGTLLGLSFTPLTAGTLTAGFQVLGADATTAATLDEASLAFAE